MEEFANMLNIGFGYIADMPHGLLGFIAAMIVIAWVVKEVLD